MTRTLDPATPHPRRPPGDRLAGGRRTAPLDLPRPAAAAGNTRGGAEVGTTAPRRGPAARRDTAEQRGAELDGTAAQNGAAQNSAADTAPFWRAVPMAATSSAQWESLCDGCGLCCQIRVEDPDSGATALSDVACRLLDLETHRCSNYACRQALVPDCTAITPENVATLTWLPWSCAYRLVAAGHDLPDWHHLVCGDPDRVHTDGPSMRGELVTEDAVDWTRDEDHSG